ncbi:MAG: DUF3823 domain-containing protein, partial [Ferruginibacter sp.]
GRSSVKQGPITGESIPVDKIPVNVTHYINKTQYVSGGDIIASAGIAGAAIIDPNSGSLEVAIPAIVPVQNYIFARIGLKIAGVEARIFTPVQKISF